MGHGTTTTITTTVVELDPPCTQEYKWRELEEQRQAQKLQKQLQQEQAYLLSLQQNQNLDSSKQSANPPTSQQNLQADRVKPPQSPEPDTDKQQRGVDPGKRRSSQHSLEKTTNTKLLPVSDLQTPAPDSEPIREVNPSQFQRCRNASSACVYFNPTAFGGREVCCVCALVMAPVDSSWCGMFLTLRRTADQLERLGLTIIIIKQVQDTVMLQ